MELTNASGSHGSVGTREQGFSRMLPRQPNQPAVDPQDFSPWSLLALLMQSTPDTVDPKPDPEENLYMPAGYTYLGQFVDHDLTFDTTSSLDPASGPDSFTNLRTPRFDLDCVYGSGPDDQPYLYLGDHASLALGRTASGASDDLVRSPLTGRAIIGDPRNDENSIVCQIQIAWIKFHNEVVRRLAARGVGGKDLFTQARNEVRWTYQRILVEDFLPRLIDEDVIERFDARRMPDPYGRTTVESAYKLYAADKRNAIPLEFSAAAYRFGHSMVRNGYQLNARVAKHIFDDNVPANPADSLVGFDPLPDAHVIDTWTRFLQDPRAPGAVPPGQRKNLNNDTDGVNRLQYAYKIDPSVVNPLANLPDSIAGSTVNSPVVRSLIFRNLMRGRLFELPFGQDVAKALGVAPLDRKYLVVRRQITAAGVEPRRFALMPVDPAFLDRTPLWFYVLAEAQKPIVDFIRSQNLPDFDENFMLANPQTSASQLGEVGGRIVLEVFNGLLDADPQSYRSDPAAECWQPMIAGFSMWNVVNRVFRP